jgi:hypothetical protein
MVFSGDGQGWSQSGPLLKWGFGYCVKRWSQMSQTGATYHDFYLPDCSLPGESHIYWQQAIYTSEGWRMRSNMDLTVIHEGEFSPFALWSTPFQAEFSAEAHYKANTIPGSASAPVDMSGLQVQSYANDNWYTVCGNTNLTAYTDKSSWGVARPSCDDVHTWQQ